LYIIYCIINDEELAVGWRLRAWSCNHWPLMC